MIVVNKSVAQVGDVAAIGQGMTKYATKHATVAGVLSKITRVVPSQ